MNSKRKLRRLERDLNEASTDKEKVDIGLNWREDDLIEFECEDGSIELISKDDFISRGGILVQWTDNSEVNDERLHD